MTAALEGKRYWLALCDVGDPDAVRACCETLLANILFTPGLARRARDRGVVATSFHPGAVGSQFGQDDAGIMRFGMRLAKRFLRTPAQGADPGIWLATAPEAASLSGRYVVDRQVKTPRGQGTERRQRTGPVLFRSSSSALPRTSRSGSVPTCA